MERAWIFLFLLFHTVPPLGAANYGGGRFGFGFDGNAGGDGSGWMGGGISGSQKAPAAGPSSSNSNLGTAYTALQAWKLAISDDPNGVLSTWTGPDVCSYKGVFCSNSRSAVGSRSDDDLVVYGIDLNRANLQGSLVGELASLSDLTLLHLNSNRFSGSVPGTFKDLSSLQELDISNNNFSGGFPSVAMDIPNLIYLDLRFNSFSGTVPEELFEGKLDAIFLNNNQFEGELPQSLGNSQASVINLANNRFTGSIPSMFGAMASTIKEILFLNNQLTGCIPEAVGFFSEVKVFDVSYNSLKGHLPDAVSCLNQIEVLNLGHNRLSGVLSDMVCSLRNLLNLTVSYNFFSGLSQECSKLLVRRVGFDFSDNCIPNKDMQRPPPDCSAFPGQDMSCFRIPSPQPLVCSSAAAFAESPDMTNRITKTP